MIPCSARHRRAGMVAFAPLVLILLSLYPAHAQKKGCKYTLFEEPSIELGRWAQDLKVGPGMNAVGKRLKGSRFVGQDLQGAVFDNCELEGVRFLECDLSKASFRGACLTGAAMECCGFEGADFTDAIINRAGLASSEMSEDQLKSTRSYKTKDLSDCRISACRVYPEVSDRPPVQYDFRKANLYRALLTDGDFSHCDFTGAGIDNIRLHHAMITGKQLASTGTYRRGGLRRMSFPEFLTPVRGPCAIDGPVDFSSIDLTGTEFRGNPLDANFSDATITKCSFLFTLTREQLASTRNYRQGHLIGIGIEGIDLRGCDLSHQNLTDSSFLRCDLSGALFDDSVITGTAFIDDRDGKCVGLTVAQIKSTWNYKHGRMEGIRLPEEIRKALELERKSSEEKPTDAQRHRSGDRGE